MKKTELVTTVKECKYFYCATDDMTDEAGAWCGANIISSSRWMTGKFLRSCKDNWDAEDRFSSSLLIVIVATFDDNSWVLTSRCVVIRATCSAAVSVWPFVRSVLELAADRLDPREDFKPPFFWKSSLTTMTQGIFLLLASRASFYCVNRREIG